MDWGSVVAVVAVVGFLLVVWALWRLLSGFTDRLLP